MKNLKLKGFTLVEILIVIVIVASLMAIVLRNISGSQEKSRNTGRIQIISKLSTDVAAFVANTNGYGEAGLATIIPESEMPKDARNLKGKGDCFSGAFGYQPLSNGEGYALLVKLEPQGKNTLATLGGGTVASETDMCAKFKTLTYEEAKKEITDGKCGVGANNCEKLVPYYVIVSQ